MFVVLSCVYLTIAYAQDAPSQEQDALEQKKNALKGQIDDQQAQIQRLEGEIKQYEQQLSQVGTQKKTLASTIVQIETSRKRAQAAIQLTQSKIQIAEKRISDLQNQITRKGQSISLNTQAAAEGLRAIDQRDTHTFAELLLSTGSMGAMWNATEELQTVESSIYDHVGALKKEKQAIQQLKTANEGEKQNLSSQQRTHIETKKGLEAVEEEKRDLLKQTKNKESEYQAILRLKKEAKEEFENQLREYESQLKYVLDQSSLPKSGSGVLRWPLSSVRITQKFGSTAFAKSGAYNGKGHNGVDFAASVGTPVFAAAEGVVEGSGNTDAYKGCYSYGKWVLIRHNNGLASLYGHLSTITASVGQQIGKGDTLGYSGNTGYSTGPHLHFTVFAANAVRIVRMADIGSTSGCRNASVPVSPTSGYLNPLDYL